MTTPATAFATFNVLSYRWTPNEVLDGFDRLCADGVSACLTELKRRRRSHGSAAIDLVETIPLHRYEAVLDRLGAEARSRLGAVGASLAAGDLPLPEQCRLVTEEAWRLSRLLGPAIVTGFGSIPYLPTTLSEQPAAARLRAIVSDITAGASARYGSAIGCADYFAGISDMSFFGEAAESGLDVVARNTPMWREGIRWRKSGGLANIRTINIGPWGRDYHTPLERLHIGHAFDVLLQVVRDVCAALLTKPE